MKLLQGRELYEHQKLAVKFAVKNKKVLLSYATGSGKESISLGISQYLLYKKLVDVSLIITTPKGIISLEKECQQFIDNYQRVKNSDDIDISRLADYNGIIICNYGQVDKLVHHVIKYQKSFSVIFNECHTIKNPKTKVSKRCINLLNLALYKIGMTGTPITRDIEDFYNLVNRFNPALLGSYENFLRNFTVYYEIPIVTKTGYQMKMYKPTKFKNLEKLKELTSNTVLTYFPDYKINYHRIYVPFDNREDYNKIVQETVKEDAEDSLRVQAPEKLIYLQHYLNKRKEKIKCLLNLVNDYKYEGLIIYCNNYEELYLLEKIFKKFNLEFKSYTGKISEKQAKEVADWFTKSPANKILFITQAGGQSINLQIVNRLIFYSLPFSIGQFLQTIGRISRQDSKFKDFNIYLLLTQESLETYKDMYLQMFSEVYKVLLDNSSLNKSKQIPSMNRWLLKRLAKEIIWS